jgi:hypothetical protein
MCDFKTGKQILRDLSGTSDYEFEVKKIGESQKVRFEVFTDADLAVKMPT